MASKQPSGGGIKGTIKAGAQEGIARRVAGSGGGGGQKTSIPLEKILVLLFVIGIILFVWGVAVAPGMESGFWDTTLGSPIKNVLLGTRQIFAPLSIIKDIIGGKEVFSFETGGAEVQKKTGIRFGELTTYGKYSNENFGVNGDIDVGEFGVKKKEESLPAVLKCEIENKAVGKVEIQDAKIAETGEAGFEIYNPGEGNEDSIRFYCDFSDTANPESKLAMSLASAKQLFTEKIKLSLNYPFKVKSKLDFFAVPETIYKQYSGKNMFTELENGVYKDYKPEMYSKMGYLSDVDISMWFDRQPLGVNREYYLRYAFRNNNPSFFSENRNEVKIKNFEIILPGGVKISEGGCDSLEVNGNRAVLKSIYKGELEEEMNDKEGDGKSGFLSCKVSVDESVLSGSSAQIMKVPDIIAELDYDYTQVVEKEISLRKKSEEKPIA